MQNVAFETPTATCGSCRATIAEAFDDVAGVESAVLDVRTRRTTVDYDPAVIDESTIAATLVEAGYPPTTTEA